MSVELQIINIPPVSQGQEENYFTVKLKNSGNENVTNVKLKVIDSAIFSALAIEPGGTGSSCLNVFTTRSIFNKQASNYNFPAGTEQNMGFVHYHVKADAPVDVHDIASHFMFTVY